LRNFVRSSAWLAVGVLPLAAFALAATPAPKRLAAPLVGSDFSRHPMWDGGKAEVSLYQTTGEKEGAPRVYETRIVVVKEDFLKGSLVKSDRGPVPGATFEVLKMNYLHDIPTGTYTHHQMVSVFFDRNTFRPIKLAMASMEACGVSFVTAKPHGRTLEHVSHSYWDGEGDRTRTIPWGESSVFYDALPVWLRGLDLATPAAYDIQLLPSQLSSHVRNVAPVPARVVVTGREGAPSMTSRGGFHVEVSFSGKVDRLWFHPGPEHVLMVWEKSDGSVLTLKKNVWLAYWEKTRPGDEKLLE
jgi:hypothetical protein